MMVVASSSASRMYAVAQLQERRSHCQRVHASSGDGYLMTGAIKRMLTFYTAQQMIYNESS